jgi:hypothetical protein
LPTLAGAMRTVSWNPLTMALNIGCQPSQGR